MYETLLNEMYPEETDPHILYELREKLTKLSKICCEWNRRKLDSKEAMYQIWMLFEKQNLREWNRKEKE